MLNQITLACYSQGHVNQLINSDTWAISELYCSNLKNYNTNKVVKCNINIQEDWGSLLNDYSNHGNVISIKKNFNFTEYFKSNKYKKKKIQLDAIHEGMLNIAKKEGWEISLLQYSYNQCIKENLEYTFYLPQQKYSPNRKYKIGFWCNWDIDIFELFWILYDNKSNQIKKTLLTKKSPFEGEFVYYLKIKWLDNSKVLVEDKYKYSKNEKWEVDVGE